MKNLTNSIKMLLCVSLVMVYVSGLVAQDRYPVNSFNLLNLSDLQEDGSFKVEVQSQSSGYEFDVKEMLLKKNIDVYLNRFHTITYNSEGKIADKSVKSVSENGGKIQIKFLDQNKDIETVSIKEDAAEFPERYQMKGFAKVDLEINRMVINNYKPDSMALVNVFSYDKIEKIEHPQAEEKDFMTPNQHVIYPVGDGNITVFYPVKSKEDAESYLKNFDFVTYNQELEVQNVFSVNFFLPREVRYDLDVFNADNTEEKIGKLVVFRKKGASGKKSPEPYKNLYEVVFLDNDGKLILHKTTKLGTTKKRRVKVEAAIGTDNYIDLIVKTNIDNVDHVGIIKIDKEGNESAKFTPESDLKARTVIIEDLKPIPVIGDRATTGTYNVALDYSAGISSEFYCKGVVKTADGDLLVYGQRMFEIVNSEQTTGGQYKTTKTLKYAEFLCFQYGPDQNLKKLYISNLPMTGTRVAIKPVVNEEGKVIFSIPIPSNEASRSKMFTQKEKAVKVYFDYYDFKVKLFQIDTKTTEAKVIEHSDFIIAHPSRGVLADKNNNKIHLFGTEYIQGEGDYLINSVVLY